MGSKLVAEHIIIFIKLCFDGVSVYRLSTRLHKFNIGNSGFLRLNKKTVTIRLCALN